MILTDPGPPQRLWKHVGNHRFVRKTYNRGEGPSHQNQ